jgi:hypothetical protein
MYAEIMYTHPMLISCILTPYYMYVDIMYYSLGEDNATATWLTCLVHQTSHFMKHGLL